MRGTHRSFDPTKERKPRGLRAIWPEAGFEKNLRDPEAVVGSMIVPGGWRVPRLVRRVVWSTVIPSVRSNHTRNSARFPGEWAFRWQPGSSLLRRQQGTSRLRELKPSHVMHNPHLLVKSRS